MTDNETLNKTLASNSSRRSWLLWPEGCAQLPSLPGVYWFSDAQKKVLYVGKAKNLKNRVTSYRNTGELTPQKVRMTSTAKYISWQPLDSELQALLTEAELINLHQPPFNILLKDDKTPLYIVITHEEWPRVLRVRKKDLLKKTYAGEKFGPFQSSYKVNEVLKIARRIFPWCNAPRRVDRSKMHRCFYEHLGLCPGVCSNHIDRPAYLGIIKELKLFLRGQKQVVIKNLQTAMKKAAAETNYELAAYYRDRIQMVEEVTTASYRMQKDFFLPTLYQAEAPNESLIYLQKLLRDYLNIPVGYEINRIEGYDVSNTSGLNAAVAMPVFTAGVADKSEYRLFNIRSKNTPDDYAMTTEALTRRAAHTDWPRPDLFLIDGGKGQVRSVLKVFQRLGGTSNSPLRSVSNPDNFYNGVPIIGLAEDPDRVVIPVRIEGQHIDWEIISLPSTHPALKILQQVRDEAHRFSKKQHTRLRSKDLFD